MKHYVDKEGQLLHRKDAKAQRTASKKSIDRFSFALPLRFCVFALDVDL
jgi:hypothetical protein